MHSLAGQLDLRHMSGLRRKMPMTCGLMFLGCLALSGFPYTAGFFSKDMILADVLAKGLTEHNYFYIVLAVVGLFTAFLTAFYTFRLWFRVFMGPTEYEMGHEHTHVHTAAANAPDDIQVEHHHDAHEVNWLMNAPLVVLAIGALFGGFFCHDWIKQMVFRSTAAPLRLVDASNHDAHTQLFGMDLHAAMMLISSMIAIAGITAAAYYHWLNRSASDRIATRYSTAISLLANKYYVDELYNLAVVQPLRFVGYLCFIFDRLIIDGIVMVIGFVPRAIGLTIRPIQQGSLQGYGIGMAAGVAAVTLFIFVVYLG